jgi:hypothetical protein
MLNLLTQLQSLVDSDRFLASLNGADVDALLDARDRNPFEANWVRFHEAVQSLDFPDSPLVDALRESAFKRAFALTQHPDLCGYVSDDLGLLADALRGGVTDPWATALFAAYAAGDFPHGKLAPVEQTLAEAVAKFKA